MGKDNLSKANKKQRSIPFYKLQDQKKMSFLRCKFNTKPDEI